MYINICVYIYTYTCLYMIQGCNPSQPQGSIRPVSCVSKLRPTGVRPPVGHLGPTVAAVSLPNEKRKLQRHTALASALYSSLYIETAAEKIPSESRKILLGDP